MNFGIDLSRWSPFGRAIKTDWGLAELVICYSLMGKIKSYDSLVYQSCFSIGPNVVVCSKEPSCLRSSYF